MKAWLMVLAILALAVTAQAQTLTWDRNSEPDMKDYQVWACFTPSCVVIKSASTLQPGTVPQTAPGVKPVYVLDLTGKEGALAVSARDTSNNESALSVPVPFDKVTPQPPVGLTLQ